MLKTLSELPPHGRAARGEVLAKRRAAEQSMWMTWFSKPWKPSNPFRYLVTTGGHYLVDCSWFKSWFDFIAGYVEKSGYLFSAVRRY